MTEEKVEEGCNQAAEQISGTEKVEAVRGLVLCCGEADRQLGIEFVPIITTVIGKAKKGDLPSLKLLLDLAEKAGKAIEISDEEMETLGTMLMREFHASKDVDNGQ